MTDIYIYIYVYVYIYIYVYMYIYIYVCMYIYIYIYIAEFLRHEHIAKLLAYLLGSLLVNPFGLVSINRLVSRQVTHVTSRVTRLVTWPLA